MHDGRGDSDDRVTDVGARHGVEPALRVPPEVLELDACRQVRRLDAVDQWTSFDRDTATDGVDARIGFGDPHRKIEIEDDGLTGLPRPVQLHDARGGIGRRDVAGSGQLRRPGPVRHP
jgi:hypothetical protein